MLLLLMCVHENVVVIEEGCLLVCRLYCIIEIFTCMTEGMGLMHLYVSDNAALQA